MAHSFEPQQQLKQRHVSARPALERRDHRGYVPRSVQDLRRSSGGASSGAVPSLACRSTEFHIGRASCALRISPRTGPSLCAASDEIDRALQREAALHRSGQGRGAGPQRAERLTGAVVDRRPGRPPAKRSCVVAVLAHPPAIAGDEAADVARGSNRVQRLDVAHTLPQPAVLVEVALREAERRVIVGVGDSHVWVEHLRPTGRQHHLSERLILRVRDIREPQRLPAVATVGGVDVRQPREIAVSLQLGAATRLVGVAGEEGVELPGDHRRGVLPRAVGSVDDTYVVSDGEPV